MVKVNAPRAIAPGMRRFGISAARNTAIATGSITNATTNKETPPYVKIAQVNTTESTARLFPNFNPTEFCDFAGLKKNVVVAGVGKRLEIWDADKYYKTMERARNIRQTFDYSQIQF